MAESTKKRLITEDELRWMKPSYALGMKMQQLADCLGVSKRTLERRLKDQPEVAVALSNARRSRNEQVAQSLFLNATENNNVSAQIFWMKTQARWSELEPDDANEQDYVAPDSLVE